MLARADEADGPAPLSWGQRVVLEGLRDFDDDVLVAAAPHVHEFLRSLAAKRRITGEVAT